MRTTDVGFFAERLLTLTRTRPWARLRRSPPRSFRSRPTPAGTDAAGPPDRRPSVSRSDPVGPGSHRAGQGCCERNGHNNPVTRPVEEIPDDSHRRFAWLRCARQELRRTGEPSRRVLLPDHWPPDRHGRHREHPHVHRRKHENSADACSIGATDAIKQSVSPAQRLTTWENFKKI